MKKGPFRNRKILKLSLRFVLKLKNKTVQKLFARVHKLHKVETEWIVDAIITCR